jgi:uncharacterized protein YndB with AHSA1/START domain
LAGFAGVSHPESPPYGGLLEYVWRMRPLSTSITIDAPRERVFDYLADIANHIEFSDHYLKDFRLERLDSSGVGAAASFRLAFGRSLWGELVITELESPYRIVLAGQTGRIGRVKTRAVYTLTPHGNEMTRLDYEVSSTPATKTDELRTLLGGRAWLKRQTRRALRRLASVLEEGQPTAHAARVAAG